MALAAVNIRFIDNYLKNSDIRYADVRSEMTDHVAEAVQHRMAIGNESFYDAFKAYMIENKKELLANHKIFQKDLDKQNIQRMSTLLVKPVMLGLFLLCYYSYYSFSAYEQSYNLWLYSIAILFGILLLISGFCYWRVGKDRYSSLERMAFFMVFFQQFALILTHMLRPTFFLNKYPLVVGFFYALYVGLSLAYSIRFLELYINYRKRTQFLVY
ncbi:hypothetical protein SAMN06265375_101589 [Muriicola jejuensis]|nr:hypothetical protein SAMN06265375_101589 [Muriicola jejuensis]